MTMRAPWMGGEEYLVRIGVGVGVGVGLGLGVGVEVGEEYMGRMMQG